MWMFLPETEEIRAKLELSPDTDPLGCSDIVFVEGGGLTYSHGMTFAEALNVHEQTGLTPAQLQARVAELEGALARVKRLTEWEEPDAANGAALNFNQGYASALETVAEALNRA